MNTNKKKLIQLGQNIDQAWLESQIKKIIVKIERNMERFGYDFPSACATDGKYRIKEMMTGPTVLDRDDSLGL